MDKNCLYVSSSVTPNLTDFAWNKGCGYNVSFYCLIKSIGIKLCGFCTEALDILRVKPCNQEKARK